MGKIKFRFIVLLVFGVTVAVVGQVPITFAASAGKKIRTEELSTWIARQKQISYREILNNISPKDGLAGSVLASPSRHDPDYYYHWTRDAALVMGVWLNELSGSAHQFKGSFVENLLWDYVGFSKINQEAPSPSGLGEPKYYVNGRAYVEPWGRPQNDGPALRAILISQFAEYLINRNQLSKARERLWPLIQRDLNYVSDTIYSSSIDLWEEFRGDNFYTRMTQRSALLLGSDIARLIGDEESAVLYSTKATLIEPLLQEHLDQARQQITENLNRQNDMDYKYSGLDTATVLAFLHTREKPWLPLKSIWAQNTLNKIEVEFGNLYQINLNGKKGFDQNLGVAIGRYPEDRYYGGNPWFLTTLAFAEYYYLIGDLNRGDDFMRRVRFHVSAEGSMAEQISRHNGYMLSARDLSWSYAAFITAVDAREKLMGKKP